MIGIDIEDISRFDNRLIDRLMSKMLPSEQQYIQSRNHNASTVAGIFCAKEAVLKCLGTGIGNGCTLAMVEITHTDMGQPTVLLHGQAQQLLLELGDTIYVSISHTNTTAIAVAMIR